MSTAVHTTGTPTGEREPDASPDFRVLFEAAPGPYLVLRADAPRFTVVAATERYLAATRTRRDGVVGRGLFEAYPTASPEPEARRGAEGLRASLDAVLRTGAPHRMAVHRYDIARPDGGWDVRYWAPLNTPVPGPDGGVQYILHKSEDVTEQVLHRSAAEAAERRAARLLDRMSDAHVVLDREFRVVYVNSAAERGLGVPASAVLGRTYWETWPASLGTPVEDAYRRVAADGVEAHVGHHYVGDGYDVHLDIDAYPTEDGGVAVFWRDVTARVGAEAERERLLTELMGLAAELARANRELAVFQAATEHSADGQFLMDEEGRIHWANGTACARLGYTPEEMRRLRVGDWNPRVPNAAFGAYFERARRGPVAPFESEHRRRDGSTFPVEIAPTVIELPEGARMLAAARDISDRKAAEAERERLLAAAEAANRAKSEFLAVMSHELRTPLNAIGGYAELMELGLRGPVTEEQRADLGRIQRAQRHLLGLINGVLNYAKVDAGAVHYEFADVPLGEVLATCEALTAPQVRARGLAFAAGDCAPGLRVRADREKLQQVVLNLLSNAVKFTEPGGRVRVACAAAGGGVALTVHDTGRGIAPDQLARVFEPFVQVDQRLTRASEGVGLGLAISRDLARGMGGELSAESTPGVGSTFTLWLPRAAEGGGAG